MSGKKTFSKTSQIRYVLKDIYVLILTSSGFISPFFLIQTKKLTFLKKQNKMFSQNMYQTHLTWFNYLQKTMLVYLFVSGDITQENNTVLIGYHLTQSIF